MRYEHANYPVFECCRCKVRCKVALTGGDPWSTLCVDCFVAQTNGRVQSWEVNSARFLRLCRLLWGGGPGRVKASLEALEEAGEYGQKVDGGNGS